MRGKRAKALRKDSKDKELFKDGYRVFKLPEKYRTLKLFDEIPYQQTRQKVLWVLKRLHWEDKWIAKALKLSVRTIKRMKRDMGL